MKNTASENQKSPVPRIIAVDWSGDKSINGQQRKIWIADCRDGEVALTSGRTREETAYYLLAASRENSELVVGLDFAFSFPAWFVREQGCESAPEFWELVAGGKGEEWLSTSNRFFWGRKDVGCPEGHREPDWAGFRQTDRDFSIGGIQPKSPFQIGGAGAVGTGSLRGLPILHRLRAGGFSVWPFMRPQFPIALEIYPRLFTGKGNKSKKEFRLSRLSQVQDSLLSTEVTAKGVASEDAFDALCSVIAMRDHASDFAKLQVASDRKTRLEGQIWRPGVL